MASSRWAQVLRKFLYILVLIPLIILPFPLPWLNRWRKRRNGLTITETKNK